MNEIKYGNLKSAVIPANEHQNNQKKMLQMIFV